MQLTAPSPSRTSVGTSVGTGTGTPVRRRGRDADGMAVASFILGLLGLLVLNLFLGPIAITLAALSLKRGTTRRGRALLGLTLGVADLAVLLVLMQTSGTVSWNF
ncbi:DUF4190 domain-containing protein [Streptomyces ipomoeae]|uniref:DUF4190 domain-containing protein n=1 Tax=Streptomyces ipomoeae TaxID=103232 RepID=UPI001146A350|nr:DUF4190 domain-containing protein [Streptomyces ipomoeae]MDX2933571.1 DUF4190 domain-containing protein [Streptomyces ipomoeae]TQE22269.1 DUF4190 domain-containing protein [Streptomyces ipomoeae]